MPKRLRLFGAFLLVCVFLSVVTPTQAAILPIEPRNPPINLMSGAELQKLVALRTGAITPVIRSQVSPDGTYLHVFFSGQGGGPAFINLKDNSVIRVPLTTDTVSFITALSELRWLDNQTITYLSLTSEGKVVVVTISVNNPTIRTRLVNLPGIPYSLAPDGKNLILFVPPLATASVTETSLVEQFENTFPGKIQKRFKGVKNDFEDQLELNLFDDATLRVAAVNLSVLNYDLTTAKVTPLYEFPAGTSPLGRSWSADSKKFALVRWLVPNIGRVGNLINELDSKDGLGILPPSENPFYLANFLDYVDVAAGTARPALLNAPRDGSGGVFGDVELNQDGNVISATVFRPSVLKGRAYPSYIFWESSFWKYFSANGQILGTLEKAEADAPAGSNQMISDTEQLLLNYAKTDVGAFYHNRANGEFRRLPVPAGTISFYAYDATTRNLIFTHSSFTSRPNIYSINLNGTGLKPITELNTALAQFDRVQANEVSYTLRNGQTRSGYLIQPAGAAFPPRNEPLIVWQEGGPDSPFLNQWLTRVENPFNLLPNFGFNILFVPLPGRYGFGAAFLNGLSDEANFGQIDIDEMAEILNQSIDRGYTSKGKIGVTGCSYGGYFVSQSITRYPDLYSAGNTQCTLLDLYQEWQFGFTPYIFKLMGRTPTQDPVEYVKDSPLYNASRVKAATLIFHGTNDFLDVRIAANFHDAVQATGSAVNMYFFNRQGHGLQAASAQLSAAQLQIEWFRKYLAR